MTMAMLALLIIGLAGSKVPGENPEKAPTLEQLAESYWNSFLENNPVEATSLGFRRYDHLLEDITPEGRKRERENLERIRNQVRGLPDQGLPSSQRLTRRALLEQVNSDLARMDCDLQDWVVDPMGGPQVGLFNIESLQPVRTVEEGKAMVKRWLAMGPYLDHHIANLRRGLDGGKVAVRELVDKVIRQLEETLARPDSGWTLLKPLDAAHPGWQEDQRKEFQNELKAAVAGSVRPALARYFAFLREEVLPKARSQDRPGLKFVPGGIDCYQQLIRVHTSLQRSPEEIHQIGLKESARIMGELVGLAEKVLGTADPREILRRLRNDPALHFKTRDEVQGKAEAALALARDAIPEWFGILPRAECGVTRMGRHEEAYSTIAYYRQPAVDGSRPGRYYINTSAPETRPRFQAEALAYHEAIPGHHLQIAIAQEITDIPEFRKHTGVTAFVEGWALYSERLADEMGLYSSDLDRIGMLSFEAWRASRLVVDTGMHAKGWSRERAIRFLKENTALAENNIVNEIDRYITWPGQALAYKMGQLEILDLRREARQRMKDRFDIRKFHDVVLGNGAVSLGQLRRQVEDWVKENSAGS